jgi:hypothetical protein
MRAPQACVELKGSSQLAVLLPRVTPAFPCSGKPRLVEPVRPEPLSSPPSGPLHHALPASCEHQLRPRPVAPTKCQARWSAAAQRTQWAHCPSACPVRPTAPPPPFIHACALARKQIVLSFHFSLRFQASHAPGSPSTLFSAREGAAQPLGVPATSQVWSRQCGNRHAGRVPRMRGAQAFTSLPSLHQRAAL